MKWCEKCKDYVICALTDKKPKCFTPIITNTAHGTPESYLVKALRFSDEFFREPTAEERKAVADYIDSISVPTGVNVFDLVDEPQTERRKNDDHGINVSDSCHNNGR